MKKLFETSMTLLLVFSLLLVCAGCAEKEDPVHPPKFATLSSLMHRPLTEFYEEMGLTEGDLVKRGTSWYELPDTVTFCDLPFAVSLSTDDVHGYFMGFRYEHDLTGSDEEKAATVQALAQHLTDALGRSQHSYAYGSVATSDRIAEMSVSEIAALLSSQKSQSVSDNWSLDIPDEEKIQEYRTILENAGQYYIPDAAAVPVIKFTMWTTSDPDQSKQTIVLSYEITYWWETVDDDFINSLPGH